jgi:acyl carrier protein
MNDELFEQIKHFVIKFSCTRNVEIDRTTTLEKGIGLTGDDAIEFILAFAKKFNVDVSNFMASDYFDAEGDKILPALGRLFFNKNEPLKKQLIFGDLERAVIAGKLDDTIIENVKAMD